MAPSLLHACEVWSPQLRKIGLNHINKVLINKFSKCINFQHRENYRMPFNDFICGSKADMNLACPIIFTLLVAIGAVDHTIIFGRNKFST